MGYVNEILLILRILRRSLIHLLKMWGLYILIIWLLCALQLLPIVLISELLTVLDLAKVFFFLFPGLIATATLTLSPDSSMIIHIKISNPELSKSMLSLEGRPLLAFQNPVKFLCKEFPSFFSYKTSNEWKKQNCSEAVHAV